MILKAFSIAYRAHYGQKDKAGKNYIWHPVTVAFKTKSRDAFVTALLHDVLEDSDCTPDDLRDAGIPENIIGALLLLTHAKGQDYMEYVKGLKHNPLAREVKIADLTHNSDLSRLPEVTAKDLKRAAKYKMALSILEA